MTYAIKAIIQQVGVVTSQIMAFLACGWRDLTRALEAIARRFAVDRDHSSAVRAFQFIGPMAEGTMLPSLKETDWQAAFDTCQLLKVIGGKDSVAPLQDLVADKRNFLFRIAAEDTLENIARLVRRLLTGDWFFMALSQMLGLVTFRKTTAGALREPADGIQ